MHSRSLAAALVLGLALLAAPLARAGELEDAVAAFEGQTGARLVFTRGALPEGAWFDRMPGLSEARRRAAARILLAEAEKYPRGYLRAVGLETVGVFEACVSDEGDGFRARDEQRGGYVFFGLWNGEQAIAAAYYNDTQLPLTFHHEVFHAVDGASGGGGARGASFTDDDARFARAVSGEAPYPAAAIGAEDLEALAARGSGEVLREAVGRYAGKSAGEDQAETARYFMTTLPDALVQVATAPELPGSQRILHLLTQYRDAAADGPALSWFVDVALGRSGRAVTAARAVRQGERVEAGVARLGELARGGLAGAGDVAEARALLGRYAAGAVAALGRADRARLLEAGLALTPRLGAVRARANDDETAFTVWVSQGYDGGGNAVLRADVAAMAEDAVALGQIASEVRGDREEAVARAQLRVLRTLARYYAYIAARWNVSRGTREAFETARAAVVRALPEGVAEEVVDAVEEAPLAALVDGVAVGGGARSAPEPARREVPPPAAVSDNPYLHKVDEAVADPAMRAAVRAVQPAAVKLGGGSGVNLRPEGLILTNAHVAKSIGARYVVLFPDGRRFAGATVAIDATLDLALVALEEADALPVAPVARRAPRVGDAVTVIGQPGTQTPEGEPTGYDRFHVSVGRIRGFLDDRLGDQALGRTKHDAWTYWGHSGSPLFNREGAIVALHNSWDSTTAMRHAVTWEAVVHFLAREGVRHLTR